MRLHCLAAPRRALPLSTTPPRRPPRPSSPSCSPPRRWFGLDRLPALDSTKSLARLILPGSRIFILRPDGFGKTKLIADLAAFWGGGAERERRFAGTWLERTKGHLLRQPSMPVCTLSIAKDLMGDASLEQQLMEFAAGHGCDGNEVAPPEAAAAGPATLAQKACKLVSKARRQKVCVLLDDIDAYEVWGLATPSSTGDSKTRARAGDVRETLDVLTRLQASNDSVGFIFATGQFRTEGLLHSLSTYRDATLDMHMATVVGLTEAQVGEALGLEGYEPGEASASGAGGAQQRYRWDEASQRPVEVQEGAEEADGEAGAPQRLPWGIFARHGGYWWGGVEELDGSPQLSIRLSAALRGGRHRAEDWPWADLLLARGGVGLTEVEDLLDCFFDYQPLKRYSHGQALCEPSAEAPVDLPSLLLQAGKVTFGSRVVQFHEFHTEGWLRLTFPNETTRMWMLGKTCGLLNDEEQKRQLAGILARAVRGYYKHKKEDPDAPDTTRYMGFNVFDRGSVFKWIESLNSSLQGADEETRRLMLSILLLTVPGVTSVPCECPGDEDGREEVTSLEEYARPWARLIRHGDQMDNTILNVEWMEQPSGKAASKYSVI